MIKHYTLYKVLIALFSIVFCISLFNTIRVSLRENSALSKQAAFSLPANLPEKEEDYKDLFFDYAQTNDEFIGWLVFESELINQPVVKGVDNDYYLNHDITKTPSVYGSVFMDFAQNLACQNITLYGHLITNNKDLMFSPLQKLMDKENYQANKNFSLYLENEKRDYVICSIVVFDATVNPWYVQGNFNEGEIQTFLNHLKNESIYDTGVNFTSKDSFISLQTCIKGQDDKRLLIFAVQTASQALDGTK